VLGIAYALISDRYTVGPPWLMLALVLVGSFVVAALHRRGRLRERRYALLTMLSVLTVGVAVTALFLLQSLLTNRAQASDLLLSAALLWASNVLLFSVWYWELDAGGARRRVAGTPISTDFAFPQMVLGGEFVAHWKPKYVDYLFLAFNTSTAFSPTDTMVLAQRAKFLMMVQSVISLTTIAVLAARAINTLPN
jgi:uncharacterized membrane protein